VEASWAPDTPDFAIFGVCINATGPAPIKIASMKGTLGASKLVRPFDTKQGINERLRCVSS
jgi:hypothetical protein